MPTTTIHLPTTPIILKREMSISAVIQTILTVIVPTIIRAGAIQVVSCVIFSVVVPALHPVKAIPEAVTITAAVAALVHHPEAKEAALLREDSNFFLKPFCITTGGFFKSQHSSIHPYNSS